MDHNPGKQSGVRLTDALEICLGAIQSGGDVETCLKQYPALTAELRPLLEAALLARSLHVEQIPAAASNRSRTKALAHAAQLREHRKPRAWFARLPRAAFNLAVAVIVLVVGLFSLNIFSARALPGEQLYPLKLAIENVWLQTASNSEARQNLETAFQQRRVEEVRQLLALGQEESVSFEGVLVKQETLNGAEDRWVVSDINVVLTPETKVVGEIKLGMLVQVEGVTQTGQTVLASVVRPRAYAFVGTVERITPNSWQIDAQAVKILSDTQIDPGIIVGDSVMVLAQYDEDGALSARAILLTGPSEGTPEGTPSQTKEPTQSQTPTPTGTPYPTSSPLPDASQTPTPSLSPTPTLDDGGPGQTGTPESTPEPEESEEPSETGTPTPTLTPTPTGTPSPVGTPPPTHTPDPEPTESETPEFTETPTETPEPTKTEEPTRTPEPTDDDDDNGDSNGNENGGGNSGPGGGNGNDNDNSSP